MTTARDSDPSAEHVVSAESLVADRTYLDAAVRSFAAGDEVAMAPAVELALRSGTSLATLYETIQRGVAAATHRSGSRLLVDSELDERFVRLVARTRPGTTAREHWQAYVISFRGLGTPACIAHLLSDAAIPALVIPAGSLDAMDDDGAVRPRRSGPARFVVIDGTHAQAESVAGAIAALRRSRSLVDADTQFLVVAEPGWRGLRHAAILGLPGIVHLQSLQALLQFVAPPAECPLTFREKQVLSQVAGGSTNAQIARNLSVGVSTIKTYLERIQGRLQSTDRASAVAIAIRRGWI